MGEDTKQENVQTQTHLKEGKKTQYTRLTYKKNKPTVPKPKTETEHCCPQTKKLSSFHYIFISELLSCTTSVGAGESPSKGNSLAMAAHFPLRVTPSPALPFH